jgi:hypothetical protein
MGEWCLVSYVRARARGEVDGALETGPAQPGPATSSSFEGVGVPLATGVLARPPAYEVGAQP